MMVYINNLTEHRNKKLVTYVLKLMLNYCVFIKSVIDTTYEIIKSEENALEINAFV